MQTQKSPTTLQQTEKQNKKQKKNPTLNNYTTSHCPEAIGKGRRGDVFIE